MLPHKEEKRDEREEEEGNELNERDMLGVSEEDLIQRKIYSD